MTKKAKYTMGKRLFSQWQWEDWTAKCKRFRLDCSITLNKTKCRMKPLNF